MENYKNIVNNRFIGACENLLSNNIIKNKSELAAILEIKPNKLSEILNNRMRAGMIEIHNLCSKYEVSYEYILSGEGEMLKREANFQNHVMSAHELPEGVKGVPLIPHDAFAGCGVAVYDDQIVEQYYYIPEFKDADFMIRVKGSSMYPKYISGDLVACERVQSMLYFQWNKVYAINSETQGFMIKRVKKSEDSDYITLVSDNSSYDPFDIPKSDITAIAIVVGLIRSE